MMAIESLLNPTQAFSLRSKDLRCGNIRQVMGGVVVIEIFPGLLQNNNQGIAVGIAIFEVVIVAMSVCTGIEMLLGDRQNALYAAGVEASRIICFVKRPFVTLF